MSNTVLVFKCPSCKGHEKGFYPLRGKGSTSRLCTDTFHDIPVMQIATYDVEQAKRQYLAQWVHRGCGGQPVAYVNGAVACSLCQLLCPCANSVLLGLFVSTDAKFLREFKQLAKL